MHIQTLNQAFKTQSSLLCQCLLRNFSNTKKVEIQVSGNLRTGKCCNPTDGQDQVDMYEPKELLCTGFCI